jgi:ribosomal protein S18 acetylase RimI-like enzyme
MHIRTVDARDHQARPDFRPYVDGQHAILLEDHDGSYQGELVWRLANIGQGIAEITGFGIQNAALRRRGWGTQMLQAALEDIRSFMAERGIAHRLVYLFANAESEAAMAFYRARGFRQVSLVPELYGRGQACVMALDLRPRSEEAMD